MTAAHPIQATGPDSQPQSSKKLLGSSTASTIATTATAAIWMTTALTAIERSTRPA